MSFGRWSFFFVFCFLVGEAFSHWRIVKEKENSALLVCDSAHHLQKQIEIELNFFFSNFFFFNFSFFLVFRWKKPDIESRGGKGNWLDFIVSYLEDASQEARSAIPEQKFLGAIDATLHVNAYPTNNPLKKKKKKSVWARDRNYKNYKKKIYHFGKTISFVHLILLALLSLFFCFFFVLVQRLSGQLLWYTMSLSDRLSFYLIFFWFFFS